MWRLNVRAMMRRSLAALALTVTYVVADESPNSRPVHHYARPNLTDSCSSAVGYKHAVCVEDQMKQLKCLPKYGSHPKCPPCDHLKNPHSMWNEATPSLYTVLGSWGVLVGALPQGFTANAPSGTGDGEFYMCDAYSDNA
eukprot:SAG31_NODE_15939_length_730_cov_1.592710_1_plen_139_part_01